MGAVLLRVIIIFVLRAFEGLTLSAGHRWLAWTCDAIDFFSVSLSVPPLETQFNRSAHDITTAITLTLLFRSVGAVSVAIFFCQIIQPSKYYRLFSVSSLIDMVASGLWS